MSNTPHAPLARSKNRAPRPILITDGDKGGAGKSFIARILAYLLTEGGHPWKGFDLDPRNGHLHRFHKEMEITHIDWTGSTAWDRLYDGIMEVDSAEVVLVDLPAQVGLVTSREYPRFVATANYLQRPILRFWAIQNDFDSVNLLAQSLEMLDNRNTFAVLNLRNAARAHFDFWNNSKTRQALLQKGGPELELAVPRLADGVAGAIDAGDLSFFKAAKQLKQPYLLYDIESYLAEIKVVFAPVLERLR